MIGLIRLFLGSLVGLFRSRAEMAAENLPLRHQLGILLRSRPVRLPLTSWDRALWAFVLHRFPAWRQSLAIVRPETVIAWHRQAFRLFWRRKSQAGRPRAHAEVRRLIREMASDNPTWGAPRIHGELLKLGFDVSERTVSRYLERIRPEPRGTGSQTWSTFLLNQAKGIVAVDLFTVPRVRFQVLYVFVVASSVPSAANSSIMSLCRVSVMRDGCFRSCRSGTTRTAFISLSRRTLLITGPSSRPRWVR